MNYTNLPDEIMDELKLNMRTTNLPGEDIEPKRNWSETIVGIVLALGLVGLLFAILMGY